MKFYHQFIFCHLIYGIHLYYNMSPSFLRHPIFILQKRAFRLIANKNVPTYLNPTQLLCIELNLLTLSDLAFYFSSVFCYKILHGISPSYIINDFSCTGHRFCFRDTHILHPPKHFFLIHMTTSFNNLHQHLRSSTILRTFKFALSKYLFSSN